MKPIDDKVFVARDPMPTMSQAGLHLELVSNRPWTGTVLAVGTGRTTKLGVRIPVDLQVGDRVLMQENAGEEIKLDGEEVYVIKEEFIMARM